MNGNLKAIQFYEVFTDTLKFNWTGTHFRNGSKLTLDISTGTNPRRLVECNHIVHEPNIYRIQVPSAEHITNTLTSVEDVFVCL